MTILIAPWARKLRNGNRSAKNYPYAKELVVLLEASGHTVIQVGCTGEEQIVANFVKDLPFKEIFKLLHDCDTFIAVDSFLQHAAWLANKRGIVLWGQSDPLIFGHSMHKNLLKDRNYLRPNQFDIYEGLACNDDAFFTPKEVMEWIT